MNPLCESIQVRPIATRPLDSAGEKYSAGAPLFELSFKGVAMGAKASLLLVASNVRYAARFLGVIPGKSVMFILEDNGIDTTLFFRDSNIFCEFNLDNKVVVFSGKLKQINNAIFPCLHLDYPERVVERDVSRDIRLNFDLEVLLRNKLSAFDQGFISGRMRSLSKGGMLVGTIVPMGFIGDEIEVRMALSGLGREVNLNLKARIRHERQRVDAGGQYQFYYGLKFVNISSEDLICIKAFLFDSLVRKSKGN